MIQAIVGFETSGMIRNDPAEIAAKLTPAQIGVLRLAAIMPWLGLNDLGRAVLAALDAKEST